MTLPLAAKFGKKKKPSPTSPTDAPVYPSLGVSCPHWLPQGSRTSSPQKLVSRVSVPHFLDKAPEVILQRLSGESGGIWGQPGERAAEGVQTTHVTLEHKETGNWSSRAHRPHFFFKEICICLFFGTLCCGLWLLCSCSSCV